MARRRTTRLQRNVNRAQSAYRTAKKVRRVVSGNVRGIRRRLKQPGSGLGQYTKLW